MSDLDHAIELISEQIRTTRGLITCGKWHYLITDDAYIMEDISDSTIYYEAPARCLETLEDVCITYDILPQYIGRDGEYVLPENEDERCDWNHPSVLILEDGTTIALGGISE